VRIATFNILHGRSPVDDRVDVERLAAAVKTLDADVLGLQEVDRDQPRSLGADLTAVAAEAMGAVDSQFVAALSGTPGGEEVRMTTLKPVRNKARGPESWVIYQAIVKGAVSGPNGVCEQAEWEAMERTHPGGQLLVQAGISSEGVAERLARGTSGDPKPRLTRETAK
jgi:hypothetical protein